MNPASVVEEAGSTPGSPPWVKDPTLLLWLWCLLAAVAWELPYPRVRPFKKKGKEKKKSGQGDPEAPDYLPRKRPLSPRLAEGEETVVPAPSAGTGGGVGAGGRGRGGARLTRLPPRPRVPVHALEADGVLHGGLPDGEDGRGDLWHDRHAAQRQEQREAREEGEGLGGPPAPLTPSPTADLAALCYSRHFCVAGKGASGCWSRKAGAGPELAGEPHVGMGMRKARRAVHAPEHRAGRSCPPLRRGPLPKSGAAAPPAGGGGERSRVQGRGRGLR